MNTESKSVKGTLIIDKEAHKCSLEDEKILEKIYLAANVNDGGESVNANLIFECSEEKSRTDILNKSDKIIKVENTEVLKRNSSENHSNKNFNQRNDENKYFMCGSNIKINVQDRQSQMSDEDCILPMNTNTMISKSLLQRFNSDSCLPQSCETHCIKSYCCKDYVNEYDLQHSCTITNHSELSNCIKSKSHPSFALCDPAETLFKKSHLNQAVVKVFKSQPCLKSPSNEILVQNTANTNLKDIEPTVSPHDVRRTIEEIEQKIDLRIERCIKLLEDKNAELEMEVSELKSKLHGQELSFRRSESVLKTEFLTRIEKLSKECQTLKKEKETIVIRYANSEKEIITEKKVQQDLEKKIKDLVKERENLLSKVKHLTSENSKISSSFENKLIEIGKLQKNYDKLHTESSSKEIKIKWLQNKLKSECDSHQETQSRLDHTGQRLNEMKEEAEQIRRDCQDMIKCYQEAEEIKSVKLDGQLKKKVSELEAHKQENSDKEQIYSLLKQELESLKKQQRLTLEENNSLTLKIQNLEKDRLEYELNLAKLKDCQNSLRQEVVDLNQHLAEMETLRLQLEREKEKSEALSKEVERLRITNADLQADMKACHVKEGELLKFTEVVTETNVKLQSSHSTHEVKIQSMENELLRTKSELSDLQLKHSALVIENERAKTDYENEIQVIAKKLVEKTKNVEKLNIKLDESENEHRVLKKRHLASIKELTREIHDCKKSLDNCSPSNCVRAECSSLGSRSSSNISLDAINSNDGRASAISPMHSPSLYNGRKSSSPSLTTENSVSDDIPGIDKEMLIERILKLQKTLAKKNDKIDFLEDHVVQLVKAMSKKSKYLDFKAV